MLVIFLLWRLTELYALTGCFLREKEVEKLRKEFYKKKSVFSNFDTV